MTRRFSSAALESESIGAAVSTTALRNPEQMLTWSPVVVSSSATLRARPPKTVRTPRAHVLGMPVDAVTEESLLAAIESVVVDQRPTVFVGLYASLFRTISHDPEYHDLVARSLTYPDGQGVVSELQQRGVAEAERLATTDVAHPVARLAASRGWRVGLYGAAPGVAERAAKRLESSAPGVEIVATWDGYSGGPSVTELREARLDVLFVALGAARQEAWAHETGVVAGVPAVLTCGGLFDFLAGDKRRAPRCMQSLGLEWAFRVMLEPRRLFTRYLLGNSYFLRHARAERAQLRKLAAQPQVRTPQTVPIAAADRVAHAGAA